jgi:hypothetical protein
MAVYVGDKVKAFAGYGKFAQSQHRHLWPQIRTAVADVDHIGNGLRPCLKGAGRRWKLHLFFIPNGQLRPQKRHQLQERTPTRVDNLAGKIVMGKFNRISLI